MLLPIFLFVVGLVLMIVGAEFLVRGSSRLAVMMGVSPLVVGLTVVAFGTSAPEFAVSFKAAYADQANICVGNVIGSNIFNILFILGLSSLVAPLIVSPQLIRFDLPLVIGVSIATLLMGLNGRFGRMDGVILFSGLIVYTLGMIFVSRKKGLPQLDHEVEVLVAEPNNRSKFSRLATNLGLMVVGLLMLVLGANWLVETAVTFATWLGVSELVIGLTIVSIGTSLPEVVTSIVASLKGERDIAVGNIVGSNLFNLLGVLGLASIVAPSGLEATAQALQFDIPVMIAVAVIALPIFFTGGIISRGEGGMLLSYYAAYTLYLILHATDDPRKTIVGNAILYIAIPLTVVWILAQSIRWMSQPMPAKT
jgi:cation:H+ antiporter